MPAKDAEYSVAEQNGLPQTLGKLTIKNAGETDTKTTITSDIDIIDIRSDAIEKDVKVDILSMLKPENGPKKLPTLLLYDEKGLQIFEEVTFQVWLQCLFHDTHQNR
jgi:hypothetical protein